MGGLPQAGLLEELGLLLEERHWVLPVDGKGLWKPCFIFSPYVLPGDVHA